MQTRLTLQIDENLIRKAKAYSRKHNKSLSLVVADFFKDMNVSQNHATSKKISKKIDSTVDTPEAMPKSRKEALERLLSMRGILKVKGKKLIDESDYYNT